MPDSKTISLTSLYKTLENVRPVRIAHRGASGLYPENTIPAMEKAVKLGADMIEFDLRLTKDGIPVVLHDPTIDRTSNGKGVPADYTFEELRKFNFSYRGGVPVYSELAIPAFEEILAEFRDLCCMNIQVYDTTEAGLKTICALYRKYEMFDRGFLAIGHEAARLVRRIDPDVEVAILGQWDLRGTPDEIRKCHAAGCRFLQPVHDHLHPETFTCAKEQGMYANVFFSDTDIENRKLIGLGASGILTNRIDLLTDTCNALKK